MKRYALLFMVGLLTAAIAYPEAKQSVKEVAPVAAPAAPAKPIRTFLTIQRYTMENNGDAPGSISNVKLMVMFPNQKPLELPANNQYWPISSGQSQEINQTYEIPAQWIQNDGFKFKIQMVQKGSEFLPCEYDVITISEFNRSYVCRVDTAWQEQHRIAPEKMNKSAVQIRVFSDKNALPKEIPTNAIVLAK